MKVYTIIPARYASTRLPRKMLLNETGKPLIVHTYESAVKAKIPAGVCVATDNDEIFNAVTQFGGQAIMTSPDCASGTDRLAEVARKMPDVDIFVNVQGDEPDMNPDTIDRCAQLLIDNPNAVMSTMAIPIRVKEKVFDPNCVKVVFDKSGRAMYFSRSPIPCARTWSDELLSVSPALYWQHLGIYAYRQEFLLQLGQMPTSPIENTEKLEQLRVLDAGYSIMVGEADGCAIGIDTIEDYKKFVSNYNRK